LRKALLLAALCMTLALALSAPVMAQDASAPSSGGGTPLPASGECPTGTQPAPPPPTASAGVDTLCIDNAHLEGYLRVISEGLAAPPRGPAALHGGPGSSTASPAASPPASATASASASASVSPLPATGGPAVSVLALGSLALLVGSGIIAFGLIHRG
jgi:hypothetical protein